MFKIGDFVTLDEEAIENIFSKSDKEEINRWSQKHLKGKLSNFYALVLSPDRDDSKFVRISYYDYESFSYVEKRVYKCIIKHAPIKQFKEEDLL